MAYVYVHKKINDGSIFYVGISDDYNYKRSRTINNRNEDWKKAVEEGEGFIVQIVHDRITYKEAKELEMQMILELGRLSLGEGPLVNITAGGQGRKGVTHTKETIEKIINSDGFKNRKTSQDHLKGKTYEEIYGEEKAKEIKEKQSKAKRPQPKKGPDHHLYGKKRPDHSAKLKGRPNEKLKGLLVGDKNPMKNLEARKKLSESKLGIARKKIECPHCGKIGGEGNMQRWHFDNCGKKHN